MRPVISKVLELGGKTYLLPIPARYRELLGCVHTFKIKEIADEEDMRVTGYRSLIGVIPDADEHWYSVEETAKCLSMMTPEQLDAIRRMCAAFALNYRHVGQFFDFMERAKGVARSVIREKGVPIKSDEGAEQ